MRFIFLLAITAFMSSCGNGKLKTPPDDSPEKGTINISVDESFEPVIEEQINMYQLSWPNTKIIAHYKAESDAIRDFLKDSATRLVIVTRMLNENETKFFRDSTGIFPYTEAIASDAVVVLLNKANNDSLFTLKRLQDQLQGKINRDQEIVFDGLKQTSTVRFIVDSILKGGAIDTSVVKAANGSEEVIKYVTDNPKAIGLIGINRIGNPEDPKQVEQMKKLKFGYVQCDVCDSTPFVQPMQQSIITKRYPLVRNLYFIMKENYPGLGTGFTSFLKYERGQLIFRRAYLGSVMDFDIRNVKYNEKLPKD